MWRASAFPASVNTFWHKASPALPPDAQSQSHNVWHNVHTTSQHTSAAYLQLVSYRTLQNVTSESFCTNEEAFPSYLTPGDEQNDKEALSILFKYQIKHQIKSKEQSPDLEIFFHGILNIGDIMRGCNEVISGIKNCFNSQVRNPICYRKIRTERKKKHRAHSHLQQ